MNTNNNTNIEDTITIIKELKDKNGRDFYVLELEGGRSILVFFSLLKEGEWRKLKENQKYDFTVKPGNDDSVILTDFKEI